jgi:transcriptional regulator with GAF, ATPase, and Fis domain
MNIQRKRSGSQTKKTKEKYEVLFKNEESEEISENLSEIIDNKILIENFEESLNKVVDIEKSVVIKKNINLLIKECINSLDTGEFFGKI